MVLHVAFGLAVLFLSPAAAPKGANRVKPVILVLRGLCAMTTIFIGSIIARSHPSAGGMVSCFPAIYLTTLISVWVAQGDKVTAGATGPMILGGLSVSIFAVAYPVLFPYFGWFSSALMSYIIAVIGWSVPSAFFLRWWTSRSASISAGSTAKISVDSENPSSLEASTDSLESEPVHIIPLDEFHASPQGQKRVAISGGLEADDVVVKLDLGR
jgi:hypothetical protein